MMFDHAANDLITQTGPATPMGKLLVNYWIPIMRSGRLEAGGAPARVKILGRRLVAFRSPDGKVGVVNEACPHRGASLAIARNEKCGLRCVFHGWVINADGELVEAPTHPSGAALHRIPSGAHPTRERNGIVWTWLGKGEPPALPKLQFSGLPDDHVMVATAVVKANWIQTFEASWDTFHAQFLHNWSNRKVFADDKRGKAYFANADVTADDLTYSPVKMTSERTDYGFSYKNIDAAKVTSFAHIMPWWVHLATGPQSSDDRAVQATVPIDDSSSLLILVMYNMEGPIKAGGYARRMFDSLPNLDDFASDLPPASEMWGQDRKAMESGESYNGLPQIGALTISYEDITIWESQGDVDRTEENLGPTDSVLVTGRRMFVDAVEAFQRGERPFAQTADTSAIGASFVPNPQ